MAIARLGRQVKRSYQSYGFYVKLSATIILGLCFVIVWSVFSSFSVTSQRQTFDDIAEPVSAASSGKKVSNFGSHSEKKVPKKEKESGKKRFKPGLSDKDKKVVNGSVPVKPEKKPENLHTGGGGNGGDGNAKLSKEDGERKNQEDGGSEVEEEEEVSGEKDGDGDGDEGNDGDGDGNANSSVEEDANFINGEEEQDQEAAEEENGGTRKANRKAVGPVFDPKKKYNWKLCNTRSKHNYIPCIDIELGKLQSYRHHERSCPRSAVMCLVPLPRDGYGTPVRWPGSKVKVYLQLKSFSYLRY